MINNLDILFRPNPNGDWPQVDSTAYIDPTAQIIGNVQIDARVFIGPNAVVRADETDDDGNVSPIEIGPECNVQDSVIIHALGGTKVTVGQRTSLGHGCIIHGPCTLGEGCFIGFGAKVFDATIGDGVYIGTGAVVHGVELAAKSFVPPAVPIFSQDHVIRLVSTTSPTECKFMEKVVAENLNLAKGYIGLKKKEVNTYVDKS
jgi:carbonic anhydrase/acetyltransferase-like protein (isoleucine patch superfamily)